jgi:hypothetical protein
MLEDKEKKIPATFYPQGFFFSFNRNKHGSELS